MARRVDRGPLALNQLGGNALINSTMIDWGKQWSYLNGQWRAMLQPRTWVVDGMAAIAVALVALPLSLAIANASGVEPRVGLTTAVLGGIVVALFGGCSLQISGPAAAMTFLVYEGITKYGIGGVLIATMMAGVMQIAAGTFRLGRIMQYIPRPVIAGFLAGIGVTILCTQLPVVLGYDVPHDEEGGAFGLLWATAKRINGTQPASLIVGLVAFVLMWGLPRLSRRIPAPLIAVLAATALPFFLKWEGVRLLGELPSGLPMPSLPQVPWQLWNEIVLFAMTVALLASLESLLSASVVRSMAPDHELDNDQELIGQGFGNVASAFFAGLPVTGVIARSATNIQAGARTRLSSLLHALIILACMLLLAKEVGYIPKAALAGVLCAVAIRMIEWHMVRALWEGARLEGVVFMVTAGAIVLTDLVDGMQIGMVAAFLYVVYELSAINVGTVAAQAGQGLSVTGETPRNCPAVQVVRVQGPLFFASGFHLRNIYNFMQGHKHLILDLENMPFLDVTGLEHLEELIGRLHARGVKVVMAKVATPVKERIVSLSRARFTELQAVPMYETWRDANLHVASEFTREGLCKSCQSSGQCALLSQGLEGGGFPDRTSVPRVRAVVSGDPVHWSVEDTRDVRGVAKPIEEMPEGTSRPSPQTSWNRSTDRPVVHRDAFIDPRSTIIGSVTIGERVYLGPGVSVRADEGAPFWIGAESNLQDNVTIHALKDKFILHQGRAYAVYIGRNVCCTHGCLIHGPCFIGDRCFIGFKSIVHDAVIGAGCVLGMGAIVIGVTVPPGRYIAHNLVIDNQDKANGLPPVNSQWEQLRDDVVEVNQELAEGHSLSLRTLRATGEEGPNV